MTSVDEAFTQALQCHQAGDYDEAERLYREILSIAPAHSAVLCNLGVLLARKGEADEAIRLYQAALAANPQQFDAHYNLGNLYRRQGRLHEAVASYQQALALQPQHPRVMLNLGLALSDLGDPAAAADLYRRALHRDPDFADAYNLLGDVLFRMNLVEEAIGVFRQYVSRMPEDPRGHHNLGLALAAFGESDAALAELQQALRLRPDYAEAHNSLGVALDTAGRVDEATTHYRQAIDFNPQLADAWSNLGISLTEQGLIAEAIDAFDHAWDVRPEARILSNRLVTLTYSSDYDGPALREAHQEWGILYGHPTPIDRPRPSAVDPARRLRIAYLSSDLRDHPVGRFVETLLVHHDRNRVHVTCYSSSRRGDERTDRLRQLSDAWRETLTLSDEELARQIVTDAIDVLIDLSGHLAGHRLGVFALRPALLQVNLFGYAATTGLEAIDGRITDAQVDPPGLTETHYTESLARLPDCAWVYPLPTRAPPVEPLPCLAPQPFTFGCLNNTAKLSEECLRLWVQVLEAVPSSRLVVMTGRSAEAARRIVGVFTQAGIDRARVKAVARLPEKDYFEAYHLMDLAFDPFPRNGGVTTCDALWMGVPVLTLAGREGRSRIGVSLLTHAGLPEFIAETPQHFIELAASWANQREALADLRLSLRDILRQSPLMDAARYTRHLEAELRRLWQAKTASASPR